MMTVELDCRDVAPLDAAPPEVVRRPLCGASMVWKDPLSCAGEPGSTPQHGPVTCSSNVIRVYSFESVYEAIDLDPHLHESGQQFFS